MKICMLAFDFLPNPGGVAAHVYELSKALIKKRHEVELITINRWNNDFFYKHEIDGIRIISFRSIFKKSFPNKINNLILLPFMIVYLLSKVKKYDLFHFHGLFAPDYYILKVLKKVYPSIKIVWTNHTSGYLELYEKNNFFKINKILKLPQKVIAPSEELAIKTYKNTIYKKNDVIYIYNGVDIEKFKLKEKNNILLKKLNINEKEKVILCTRRLEKKNGVRYLVEAVPIILKTIPNLKVILIGDFDGDELVSDRKIVDRFIKDNDLNNIVLRVGNLTHDEIIDYYSICDITVLPSLMEAVSISGLESLASGKPIVGTNVGGIPEIIEDGKTGFLVEPKNSEQLAKKIIELLTNDTLRQQMSIECREKAIEKFSWDYISKKTIEVYKKVLNNAM